MNRIKKWLSIQQSQNARLLLLVGIILFNVFLWLISSIVAYLIDPDLYGSVVSSLWGSGITWMLEPGFYDPSLSPPIRIISIIVIITSMITFSGGIIAYVANLFSSIIEQARKGRSALYIYDHILILNWNTKALELIADYRFDENVTEIVVLSQIDKDDIEKQIKRKMYEMSDRKHTKKMKIIVKEGDVYSQQDLDHVCLSAAKTIIILANEDDHQTGIPDNPDILSIKSLMLIANTNLRPEQTIIVEIRNESTLPLIKDKISRQRSLERQIIPILPDEMLGRLIAQTILYPYLNQVFQELLSFAGMEFYGKVNGSFSDEYTFNPCAIPVFERHGILYMLSESERHLSQRRVEPFPKFDGHVQIRHDFSYPETTIVIFGKNNKLKFILDSLKWFEQDANTTVHITHVPANDPKTIAKYIKDIEKIDTILVLSDDLLDPKDFDSSVLVTLLMIQEIAKNHQAKIVLELLNPRHYDIAKSYNIENTIISNQYVSRIITQLSKNPSLYPLYMELLTYDAENASYEIYTFPVDTMIQGEWPISFASASELIHTIYDSSNATFMPIGRISSGVVEIFHGNLDHTGPLTIEQGDQLIVLCQ